MRTTWTALGLGLALWTGCSQPSLPQAWAAEAELARHFDGVDGVFVLRRLDGDGGTTVVGALAPNVRVAPCSTFKVPHALIGLASGVLRGPEDRIAWNGSEQPIRSWERDHTLRTAIRDSVLWYFQDVARRIRRERMQGYLEELAYGRGVLEPAVDAFWLTNAGWTISPAEQTDFFARLYRDELPLLPEPMRIVRDLLVLERRGDTALSGKTGSSWPQADGLTIGWFVGHVRGDAGEYVFATLVRARENAFGKHAREATEHMLDDLGIWRHATFTTP